MDDAPALLYTTDHKVYAKTAFKKGALKLFPAGAVQKVKEASAGSQDKKQKKDNVVKVVGSASTYTVQQPKYDLQKGEGCLVPFFWVTQTQEEGQAVLTLQEQKFDFDGLHLKIPFFRNDAKIEAGSLLCVYKAPVEEGPKAKKAKKA